MSFVRSSLIYFLSFLIGWTPVAGRAQAAPQRLPEMIEIIGKDQNGDPVKFQIPRASQEELKKDSPMEIAKQLMLKATMNTHRRILPESGLFFVAVGAVTLLQLSRDYSANPMRMSQHIDHTFSPMGAFSMYMYMQASGVSSNILTAISKNQEFHRYIPYLGMTAGYFTQSMLSSFAADPNVRACANLMLNKEIKPSNEVSTNPCESAFSFYVLGHRLLEMVPGMISMLASTAIAGLIQKYALKGAIIAAENVFRFTGFDIATFVLPGGLQSWGVRLLILGVQNGLFYYIDNGWLNRRITFAWKNVFSGTQLSSLENELTERILWKKKNGWAEQNPPFLCGHQTAAPDCEREVSTALKEMHDRLGEWRIANMAEIHEAHQFWQTRLSTLTSQFNATFEIYKELVNEARNSKWKFGAPYRLDMDDPLYGVIPKQTRSNPLNSLLQYEAPQITQNYSSETAKDVGFWLRKKISDQTLTSLLIPHDLKLLQEIAEALESDEITKQGRGLEQLQKTLFLADSGVSSSPDLRQLLLETKKRLGENSRALFEPGRGFLFRLENYSAVSAQLKTVRFHGMRADQTPAQFLLIPAICGPEGTSPEIISSIKGFSAHLSPPRIANSSGAIKEKVCGIMSQYPVNALFKAPLEQEGKTFIGLLDYLKKNLLPEILGSEEESGFISWWEKGPQTQMKLAFDQYASEYEEIILKMFKIFKNKKNSVLNLGPVANNPMEAFRQQVKMDLLIYGEMFKDLYEKQYRFPMPLTAFSPSTEVPSKNKNLLFALGAGKTQIKIQNEILSEFEKLISMVMRVEVVEIEGKPQLQNFYENSDFDDQVKVIEEKLILAGRFLGGEKLERGVVRLENEEQRKILGVVLQGLKEVAMEISIYGGLMNAVSWNKIRRLKETSTEQSFYRSKLEMSLKKLGSRLSIKGGIQ